MADPLSTIVDLQITEQSVGITAAGFGVMLILSANATFPERARYYQDTTDASSDGWAATSPEYLAIAAAKAQNPSPPLIGIGRADGAKPTQVYQLGVAAVRDSHAYRANVKGQGVTPTALSITSDSSATKPEIANALLTALNAVVGKNFLATFAPLPTFSSAVFTAANTAERLIAEF